MGGGAFHFSLMGIFPQESFPFHTTWGTLAVLGAGGQEKRGLEIKGRFPGIWASWAFRDFGGCYLLYFRFSPGEISQKKSWCQVSKKKEKLVLKRTRKGRPPIGREEGNGWDPSKGAFPTQIRRRKPTPFPNFQRVKSGIKEGGGPTPSRTPA